MMHSPLYDTAKRVVTVFDAATADPEQRGEFALLTREDLVCAIVDLRTELNALDRTRKLLNLRCSQGYLVADDGPG